MKLFLNAPLARNLIELWIAALTEKLKSLKAEGVIELSAVGINVFQEEKAKILT